MRLLAVLLGKGSDFLFVETEFLSTQKKQLRKQ